MKIIVLFLFLYSNICFSQNTYKIEEIAEDEYLSLKLQFINIQLDTSLELIEDNNSICLPLEDNSLLNLENDTVEGHMADYLLFKYLGFLANFNVYVLDVTMFSDNQIWFINKTNGNITKTLRFYTLSNKYIVSYDLPDCDRYHGIEILCNTKKGLQKTDAFTPKWVIDDLFSTNEDIFIIKAHPIINHDQSLFFRMQMKKGNLIKTEKNDKTFWINPPEKP